MRRWHILNRLRRSFARQESDRCVLVVEELEAREVLSPVVIAPSDGFVASTPEGVTYTVSAPDSFGVFDFGQDGPTYQADLTAINGTVSFATLPAGTTTFTGTLPQLNALLASGITFQPTDYFSGVADITLTVTDTANPAATDNDTLDVTVTPVASVPAFGVQSSGEVWAPSSGFVFPPGFVSVAPWPDLDGSETVTVTFSLDAANPDAFTLSAGGVPLTPLEPGLWQISGTDPAALQATLDSLELTPPADFNGFADLSIYASNADRPPDDSSPPDTADLGFDYVSIRFFVGGSVITPTVFGVEGGSVDLGGRFVASDPDEMFGDYHTLTLSVPGGTLAYDPSLVPEGVSVESDGGTSITVSGTIDGVNQFLATSGSMTYAPASPYFSGVVPLSITLTNQPGDRFSDEPSYYSPSAELTASLTTADAAPNAFSGVAELSFVPVADHVFPSAVDVTTNQDTPVALSISTTALADPDGSESVLIVLEGIPEGATLNHGTDLGGGQWALSTADLAALEFTPPPGATGTYTLTVKAIVTDTAPDLGASDSATESTTFTVTVLPVPVTTSPPPPVSPPVVPPVTPTVSPVVQNLPPLQNTAAVFSAASITNTTTTVTTTTTTTSTESAQTTQLRAVTFDAYSSAPNTDQISATQTQVGYSPPVQGSLFSQAEAPLPTYAYGEKHPLPPVLPLDQTLPVAGFSDSGGDSFALIDKLYRDANDHASANPVTPPAAIATQAALATVTLVWNAPASTLAVTPEREANTGNQEAAPVAPEPPESNWPTWLAASAVAGVLAAWAWLARGSESRLTRGVRRFFRAIHRRPSQRTT